MSRANDYEIVKLQYNTDKNLNKRRALHLRFSTNKYGWSKWAFERYNLLPKENILELGCGNGAIWKENKDRIPGDVNIVLTDLSQGMLEASKIALEEVHKMQYSLMDIQDIKYPDNSFDVVIANHMLYHVPNRVAAIKEVARVLKPNGRFCASTNGINNLKELKEIVENFDPRVDYATYSIAEEFGLENGSQQLLNSFEKVELLCYEDALEVTEPGPLIDYILSMEGHSNINEVIKDKRLEEFRTYLEDLIKINGSIHITKASGMFIASLPI